MLYSFTWTLCSVSLVIFGLRMYTRARLTRNLWWDDWFIAISVLFTLTFSIMWSVYAGRGYARHAYYLRPEQLSDAGKLSVISRSLVILAIASGKISVAFLIQRIQGPSKWRLWVLRFISISVFVTALPAVIVLFTRCQPARALWTPSMIKNGTGHCGNPIPPNNYAIVVAGYFAFLDFALAIFPVDIIWKLKMARKKKLWLCVLLGMGIFAGVCATIKTSQLRTVTKYTDITWELAQYLLWNALEVNVIIVAACIPTLRPLFLVAFKQAGAEAYLKKSYQMTPKNSSGQRWRQTKPAEATESTTSINGDVKGKPLVHVAQCPGSSSGRGSTEESEAGDIEAQIDESTDGLRRKSSGGIMHTTNIEVVTFDGREREAQHIV